MPRNELDLNIVRAMEVFCAVVESEQITRAARHLGITQSAELQHTSGTTGRSSPVPAEHN